MTFYRLITEANNELINITIRLTASEDSYPFSSQYGLHAGHHHFWRADLNLYVIDDMRFDAVEKATHGRTLGAFCAAIARAGLLQRQKETLATC